MPTIALECVSQGQFIAPFQETGWRIPTFKLPNKYLPVSKIEPNAETPGPAHMPLGEAGISEMNLLYFQVDILWSSLGLFGCVLVTLVAIFLGLFRILYDYLAYSPRLSP